MNVNPVSVPINVKLHSGARQFYAGFKECCAVKPLGVKVYKLSDLAMAGRVDSYSGLLT